MPGHSAMITDPSPPDQADTYVVRLYRVGSSGDPGMAGLVEDLRTGTTGSFRSGAELLKMLRRMDAAAATKGD